jgi:hypothetical protein
MEIRTLVALCAAAALILAASGAKADPPADEFTGAHYRGAGDTAYVGLLDTARRMFDPDPELQSLSMLYNADWDGFVEGPTWGAWWIQNSYGTSYCALPFLQEPYWTFLQNAQDLWFDQMGDGKRSGAKPPYDWVAPDGCLCDCASPGWIMYRQGDGNVQIHDWGMEFTAAGLLLQSELLLIQHDRAAVERYLPRLERCANFLETRRDPKNSLYLAGPAGNLLAPSYAGWPRPDGTYQKAYLTGLSVTTIAALERLIEVEKLAGRPEMARTLARRRAASLKALSLLTLPDGCLIRSLDPDGVKHGVFGAAQHGYFEASPNHDAVCFRVTDDAQSKRIMDRMTSIPQLRPHAFVLPNYPSYDDMYTKPEGLWGFGTWVNGGHWSTCEARMIMAYYRTGRYEDARRSMEQILTFARKFRMDNPLTHEGAEVYQPKEPVNLTYDAFGPPTALLRGLFEYLYRADRLILVPHVPPGIKRLEQLDPVRFGTKRIYLGTEGSGPVTGVRVNGKVWRRFSSDRAELPYDLLPDEARVTLLLGGARYSPPSLLSAPKHDRPSALDAGSVQVEKLSAFIRRLDAAGLLNTYEGAHALLVMQSVVTTSRREELVASGAIRPIQPKASQDAADRSYVAAADRLWVGLDRRLKADLTSPDPVKRKIADLWK